MSQWIERINNHPVWGELKSLGISIDLALAREGNDATVIDGLERIRTVLAFCGKRMASTDPILIEPRPLVTLVGQLAAARGELDAFITDGLPTHIAAANARADEILVVLPSVLAPISTEDLTIINDSISSYRTTLEKYLQSALTDQQKVKEASVTNENKIKALEVALTAEQCGFNPSMQHTKLCESERSVADETTTSHLLHRHPEGPDVGSLESRRFTPADRTAV